ncbi:MAG TPA: CPBP family intramembrane glutamic endopeptidase [Candidatus Angelobacter sp.]
MNSTAESRHEAPPAPKSRLIVFFLLTYAITWPCFILVAVAVSLHTILGQVLVLLGTFAPSFVAVWLTSREGDTTTSELLGRIFVWRVGFRWYLFAAGYMAAIKLIVALLHRVITGMWPRFGDEAWYLMLAAFIFSTPFQAGEEIGWRGYALPRMAGRMGLANASLVLGVIWALWHLPLFFVSEADTYRQPFFLYTLQVTALSVAIAWLYARTNGSLLLVMLLHAAVNNTKDIVPSATPGGTNTFGIHASLVFWLTIGLLWLCAAYFLIRMPRKLVLIHTAAR